MFSEFMSLISWWECRFNDIYFGKHALLKFCSNVSHLILKLAAETNTVFAQAATEMLQSRAFRSTSSWDVVVLSDTSKRDQSGAGAHFQCQAHGDGNKLFSSHFSTLFAMYAESSSAGNDGMIVVLWTWAGDMWTNLQLSANGPPMVEMNNCIHANQPMGLKRLCGQLVGDYIMEEKSLFQMPITPTYFNWRSRPCCPTPTVEN